MRRCYAATLLTRVPFYARKDLRRSMSSVRKPSHEPAQPTRVVRFSSDDCGDQKHWGLLPKGIEDPMQVLNSNVEIVSGEDVANGVATPTGETACVDRLHAPLESTYPPAILAAGLNYKGHAKETGKPLPRFPIFVWLNPASICPTNSNVTVPPIAQDPLEVDYEVELAIVIGGRVCRDVTVEEAMNYVAGFTVANDISARRWQGRKGGGQWCRAKSFDAFTPLGPALALTGNNDSKPNWQLWSKVNGESMQESNTGDMIFSPSELVSFASQGTTLLPGTVLLTGTPQGVGYTKSPPVWLRHGDMVEVGIEGIGCLRNKIVYDV